MDALRLRCAGKINLFLDVGRRRRDGFTDIETIFQTVDVCDELHLTRAEEGIALTCDHPGVPTDEGNLAVRAARLLQERTGTRAGVRMALVKRLPVAGGMAGGSADAAGALVGLNRLWGLGLTQSRLLATALELGSDVPYCVMGGTAFASGRGERLTRLEPPADAGIVLVHPPLEVAAREAYGSPSLTRSTERPYAGWTRSARRARRALRRGAWAAGVFNRLETGVFPMHPELAEIKAKLLERGCVAAALSGSGATVFGVCGDAKEAARIAAGWSMHPARATRMVGEGIVALAE